jgi:large subunit ribosomal protein L6
MSRIGKKPIQIPPGVDVTVTETEVRVKGPKGELKLPLHRHVRVARAKHEELGDVLTVTVTDENDKKDRALWGLFNRLIANLVVGVTKGYEKSLEFVGVGYKVAMAGKTVKFDVGYSHEIDFDLPAGIDGKVDKNTLTLTGIDKQLVGETAARIRRHRKPEPYKGKGIKYVDEVIRRKAGKAAKATGAK